METKMRATEISLVTQWLRLHASNVRHVDSIPGQGARTPNAVRGSQQQQIKKMRGTKPRNKEVGSTHSSAFGDFSVLFPNLSAILSKQWQELGCAGTSRFLCGGSTSLD